MVVEARKMRSMESDSSVSLMLNSALAWKVLSARVIYLLSITR